MKILHTSDLHLGHRLLERSRLEEQAELLQWLVQIIRQEEVDLLILAGDIFDTGSPPNSALSLYYDFLHRVADTACRGTIIIGGNHDSVAALNAPRRLLAHFRVHVVGGGAEPEEELIVLRTPRGEPELLIGAVPFLRERELRTPRPGEGIDERNRGIIEGIRNHYLAVEEAAVGYPGVPLILTGHLFAAGLAESSPHEGERDLYVGNLGRVESGVFSSRADYVALGHIHRAASVGGNERIRYSGAPLPLDFGDTDQKSLTLITLNEGREPRLETFPVPLFRRLVSLEGTLAELLWRLNGEAGRDEAFVPWLDITVTDPVPEAQERIEEAAAELEMEILRVRYARSQSDEAWEETELQLNELSPDEVFRRRCESMGVEDDEELHRAFTELLTEAERRLAEEAADGDTA